LETLSRADSAPSQGRHERRQNEDIAMPFPLSDQVQVERDPAGTVQQLEHLQQPYVAASAAEAFGLTAGALTAEAESPRALAESYLSEVAALYGIDAAMLPGGVLTDEATGIVAAAEAPGGAKLEIAQEKELMGTTTIAYQQFFAGLPVWEAGVNVTVLSSPMRVTASQSSVHQDLAMEDVAAAESLVDVGRDDLVQGLGLATSRGLEVNGTRRLIYRFDPDKRIDPEATKKSAPALEHGPPTLPLPRLPRGIEPGRHYVVTEVLFSLPVEGQGMLNWRAFVEVETKAVLYVRAFVACLNGQVFSRDPTTAGAPAAATPTAPAATLDPLRASVPLSGLTASNPQTLSGQFVQIVDTQSPTAAPPTMPPATDFNFSAPTRGFSAVNAYHHCDWLFRYMQGMGFNLGAYFDGTTFPVPVDACALSDNLNAQAPGNMGGTGSGGFRFGLAGAAPAVSIAADLRVVLHEFGHTILWDSVHSPNFGFAHSAGDSLAAIMLDPDSALRTDPVNRFLTFPWVLPGRNHGRTVSSGWGWGGVSDTNGYNSEQILSTTHFRIYRSLGGDDSRLSRRQLAARQSMYLIYRGVGSLASNPVTPTPNPGIWATALMNADIGTANFEGYRGGTFHKVIRWAFEKQGLYQPVGAPVPVNTAGAPPPVDVYIDDGRAGEYPYQEVHWNCTDIWNRLAPSAGGGGGAHQTPVTGQVNFAYVRVRNRGTSAASGVVVKGYSANPGAGLSWPAHWTPMTTASITVPGSIPSGGSVVVGPFHWTPQFVGHECMFMEVSATGDASNINPSTFFPCAAGPTPEWRLIPFDNNLGQRNVAPVAGGGGLSGLLTSFVRRQFRVRNPMERETQMTVTAKLPPVLAKRSWRVKVGGKPDKVSFNLKRDQAVDVSIEIVAGRDFTPADLGGAKADRDILILVHAGDTLIGGMTYRLDPALRKAPKER